MINGWKDRERETNEKGTNRTLEINEIKKKIIFTENKTGQDQFKNGVPRLPVLMVKTFSGDFYLVYNFFYLHKITFEKILT